MCAGNVWRPLGKTSTGRASESIDTGVTRRRCSPYLENRECADKHVKILEFFSTTETHKACRVNLQPYLHQQVSKVMRFVRAADEFRACASRPCRSRPCHTYALKANDTNGCCGHQLDKVLLNQRLRALIP